MSDTYYPAGSFVKAKKLEAAETITPIKLYSDPKQESIVYQSSLKVVAELVAAGKEDQLDKVLLLARKVARLALNPNLNEILSDEEV